MAKAARKIADIQESVWIFVIKTILSAIGIMLIAGTLAFFLKFFLSGNPLSIANGLLAVAGIVAFGIVFVALYKGYKTQKLTGVRVSCPYCLLPTDFEVAPTTDFDCENCHRTVHYINGEMAPVKTLVCKYCKSEHIVAVHIETYTCDKCNRVLEVNPSATKRKTSDFEGEAEGLFLNYDVLLIAVDRRKETEVAMKLQNLLVTNLPEARRLMNSASTSTPVIVLFNQPQRKAEAVRRQLQELGATATIRPTSAY